MLLEAKDIRVSFRKENQTRLFGRERQEVLHGLSIDPRKVNASASSANRVRANLLSDVSSADCLRPTPARFVSTGSISTAASRAPTKRAFSRAFPLFFRITPLRPIRAFAYRALLGNPSVPCV